MKNITKAAAALVGAALILAADTGYKLITKYPVPGNGSYDYLTLDQASRRLFMSHGNQVDVVDADSGKVIGVITDTPGVHGIAIAGTFKHGFTTNGKENKVSMFDPTTLQTVKKIAVGGEPDGIFYDVPSKHVFTNNHGTHDVSVIDAEKGEVVGSVDLKADGEQTIKGADGLLYVNGENTGEVIAYDPKTFKVMKRYPVGVAKTPTGLAYDAKTNRLFIGCRAEPKMVVMDAGTGKVITTMPIGTGVDWAEWDPDTKTVFMSTGEGVVNAFHQKSADVYEDAGPIKTQPNAKTMAMDPKTKKIFLTAADYDVKAPEKAGGKASKTLKPNSFVVLVLGK